MGTLLDPDLTRALLYPYLALAFTLMVTVFHHRSLRRNRGELRAILLYFVFFFLCFLAVPLALILLTAASPAAFLRSAGLTFGQAGRGLLLSAIAVPLCLIAAFIGSHDPALRQQYPFAKTACRTPGIFAAYEAAYLCPLLSALGIPVPRPALSGAAAGIGVGPGAGSADHYFDHLPFRPSRF